MIGWLVGSHCVHDDVHSGDSMGFWIDHGKYTMDWFSCRRWWKAKGTAVTGVISRPYYSLKGFGCFECSSKSIQSMRFDEGVHNSRRHFSISPTVYYGMPLALETAEGLRLWNSWYLLLVSSVHYDVYNIYWTRNSDRSNMPVSFDLNFTWSEYVHALYIIYAQMIKPKDSNSQHMALIVSILDRHACKSSEMVWGIVKIHVPVVRFTSN